jgi:hypothetical protein
MPRLNHGLLVTRLLTAMVRALSKHGVPLAATVGAICEAPRVLVAKAVAHLRERQCLFFRDGQIDRDGFAHFTVVVQTSGDVGHDGSTAFGLLQPPSGVQRRYLPGMRRQLSAAASGASFRLALVGCRYR